MKTNTVTLARWLAVGAGGMDLVTGLGLVFAPTLVLRWMGVADGSDPTGSSGLQGDGLVFLRWVGAFVAAVGVSYLLAVERGGRDRLRSVMEFTIAFRLAAGCFSAAAVGLGWLSVAWVSVPAADLSLVGVQVWLLCRGGWGDE
jgi:hypothetical protein